MSVIGSISIKDNASSVLKNVRQEQTAFREDVKKTKRELTSTWDKQYEAKINTASAVKKVGELKKKVNPLKKGITTIIKAKDAATAKVKKVSNKAKALGKKVVSPIIRVKDTATAKITKITGKIKGLGKKIASPFVKIKDAATAKIAQVTGKIKALGKKVVSPIVKLKDQVSSGISKIKGKIAGIAKKVAIPVTIAATVATAVLGGAVKSGMQLENQQVSMKHFIGATNKGMDESAVQKVADEFTQALRENSNKTPFETGEVLSAGTRALSVASGDTKEAMNLVKLAEDMAAASGGTKSISDAMEALADAKLGETERLKEFGFKVSAEEFDAKGFTGVSSDLQDFFGGAAEKLSQTGSGLMSTIKGKLKSNFADFGLNIVNKLKPVMENMITIIDKAQPALEAFGNTIADKIGSGIETASTMMPVLLSFGKSLKPVFESLVSGFKPLIPQIVAFATSIASTVQQISIAAMPAIASIITTVQTVIPAVLPVLQTVITTIGTVISQAAPIIAGMVQGIGVVITTLAPIFQTIFTSIGEKVGSVIGFVGERMGFIQEVIGTAAPLIGDILSTAWGVISPVMDIAINAFKLVFEVVQKVFPGIQSVIETVWGIIKPIVEGIGGALSTISDGWSWLVEKVTGESAKGTEVGANAQGDNNWKGGPTWVGEEGAELVDLPRGSRILPHKESVSFANASNQAVTKVINTKEIVKIPEKTSAVQKITVQKNSTPVYHDGNMTVLGSIEKYVSVIVACLNNKPMNGQFHPAKAIPQFAKTNEVMGTPNTGNIQPASLNEKLANAITVTIAKIADTIIVREEADIEKISNSVAKKVVEVARNMA